MAVPRCVLSDEGWRFHQDLDEETVTTNRELVSLSRNSLWDSGQPSRCSWLRAALSQPHFTPAPSKLEGPLGLVPGNSLRGLMS